MHTRRRLPAAACPRYLCIVGRRRQRAAGVCTAAAARVLPACRLVAPATWHRGMMDGRRPPGGGRGGSLAALACAALALVAGT